MKKFFKIISSVSLILIIFIIAARVYADDSTDATTTAATSTGPLATSTPVLIPDPVQISLEIIAGTTTLTNTNLIVSACPVSPDATTSTVNAYCALQQSGLTTDWSWWGDDAFLNSIGSFANDFGNNISWNWFADLRYGLTALNKHTLSQGEHLLLAYNIFPLQIVFASTSPVIDATTTIHVDQFAFDSSWNGIWIPAASSTVFIDQNNQNLFTDANGNVDVVPTSTSTISIQAHKDGFIDTAGSLTVLPAVIQNTLENNQNNPVIQSGGGVTNPSSEFDILKAFAFLTQQQKPDGSFGSDLYTDWAAIAFSLAQHQDSQIQSGLSQVKNYEQQTTPTLISATDYERHAMALMALGVNPYSGTSINYIQKIQGYFDGNQIGDPGLINDDIFALFPLMHAGFSRQDLLIQKVTQNIINNQQYDGSWEESVDLTAAATQALSQSGLNTLPNVPQALTQAENYFRAHQNPDGSFGNIDTTSWTIQAIDALGEDPTLWKKATSSLLDYLAEQQQSDGGIGLQNVEAQTRIWSTAYAISAALSKSWPQILNNFSKPQNQIQTQSQSQPQPVQNLTLNFSTTTLTSTSSQQITASYPIKLLASTHTISVVPDISVQKAAQEQPTINSIQAAQDNSASTQQNIQAAAIYSVNNFNYQFWSLIIGGILVISILAITLI